MTLEKALALLSLPREVARHPASGEPILAGIGRYGAYVQHGKTYANLGRDDDVLEIGGNRAIDLIVAKESGAGAAIRRRRGGSRSRRASRGRPGRRQAGPLRRLRQPWQDQRHHPEGDQPGDAYARRRGRAARGQGGGGRRFRAPARRASGRRPGDGARRTLWRLRQLGQGQRDDSEVDRPGFDFARSGSGADRRARGQACGSAARRAESIGEENGRGEKAPAKTSGSNRAPTKAKPAASNKPAAKVAAAAKPKSATSSKRR